MKKAYSWATSAAAASADGYDDVMYAIPAGLWDSEEKAKHEAACYFANLNAEGPIWEPFPAPLPEDGTWWKADLRYEGSTVVDEVVMVWGIEIK